MFHGININILCTYDILDIQQLLCLRWSYKLMNEITIQSLHWKAVPHRLYFLRNNLYLSNSLLSSRLTLLISVSLKVFGSLEKPLLITGYRGGAEAIWVDVVLSLSLGFSFIYSTGNSYHIAQ